MLKRLITWRAKKLMVRRPADFIIGGEDNPYMFRWWWLPRNRFLNVYVHKVVRDDDDRALHDHPWPSLSLMIEGMLFERYRARNGHDKWRIIYKGQWVYRPAKFLHRLVLPDEAAITVFITGPRIREWGFACPKGWVHWRDFVAVGDKGNVGRGCGEE